MYCWKCGTPNEDRANHCIQCGSLLHEVREQDVPHEHIASYMFQSILVTLFCCLPFGILAIVNSAKVQSRLAARDYAGAKEASEMAMFWAWVSFGVIAALVLFGLLSEMGRT